MVYGGMADTQFRNRHGGMVRLAGAVVLTLLLSGIGVQPAVATSPKPAQHNTVITEPPQYALPKQVPWGEPFTVSGNLIVDCLDTYTVIFVIDLGIAPTTAPTTDEQVGLENDFGEWWHKPPPSEESEKIMWQASTAVVPDVVPSIVVDSSELAPARYRVASTCTAEDGGGHIVPHRSDWVEVVGGVPLCNSLVPTIVAVPGVVTIGTDGDDVIAGTPGADDIRAGAGNDVVCSGDGDDEVDAGAGNDVVLGGDGDDMLLGGSGRDHLDGGEGHDVVRGGQSGDELFGGKGDDLIFGGRGPDLLVGDPGEDKLRGGPGNDSAHGGFDTDITRGGPGDDYVNGSSGYADIVYGGKGNDVVKGGKTYNFNGATLAVGPSEAYGGPGDDHLSYAATCKGGPGKDTKENCYERSGTI